MIILLSCHYYNIYKDPQIKLVSPIVYWKEKYDKLYEVKVTPQYKYDCVVEPNCKNQQLVCIGNTTCKKIKEAPVTL